MRIYGLDFTSTPSKRKPITRAQCLLDEEELRLLGLEEWHSFAPFEALLETEGPWLAAMDFPFGLPSEFVAGVGWGARWSDYILHLTTYSKEEYKACLKRYKATRPRGQKDLKRLIDKKARAISPLNITHPPVGLMLFEGAPRLLRSNASIIPMRPLTNADRIIVEGYPALVAEQWIKGRGYKGTRPSERAQCRLRRARLVKALTQGEAQDHYGFRIAIAGTRLRKQMIEDSQGDLVDAFLCAIQGAWAWSRRRAGFGIPEYCDLNEGWITDPAVAQCVSHHCPQEPLEF